VSEELTVTVGEVCRKCNEGWLSRLEERVKAIACPAIVGRRCVWSPKEQRTLALWAFKTAFMMTLATGTSSVPPADYRFLFRNLRPRGRARVWAAAHAPPSGPAVSLSLAHIQPVELTLHKADGTNYPGYALTFNAGCLAFQVLDFDTREPIDVVEHHLNDHPPETSRCAFGLKLVGQSSGRRELDSPHKHSTSTPSAFTTTSSASSGGRTHYFK
jgi:hypothetical protein